MGPFGEKWKQLVRTGAAELNVPVTDEQADLFARHAAELIRWNRKINLTAITNPEEMAVKHYIDSAAAAPFIPEGNATILDMGTGGGFPGIPLKILLPGLKATLLDASRKKVNFLKHVVRQLDLRELQAIDARAEHLAGKAEFQVILSRAFSDLGAFIEMGLPLLSKEGRLIALKGKIEPDEINAAQRMLANRDSATGVYALRVETYRLPVLGFQRSLVIVRKQPVPPDSP